MEPVGTFLWMAPEVAEGKEYTSKADVYSYGIIMYEILTRQEPYEVVNQFWHLLSALYTTAR